MLHSCGNFRALLNAEFSINRDTELLNRSLFFVLKNKHSAILLRCLVSLRFGFLQLAAAGCAGVHTMCGV